MPSKKMIKWMKNSTSAEKKQLARMVGTEVSYLYQLTYTGPRGRSASPDMAARIAEMSRGITALSNGRLPELTRGDLNAVCAACPYYKKCVDEGDDK